MRLVGIEPEMFYFCYSSRSSERNQFIVGSLGQGMNGLAKQCYFYAPSIHMRCMHPDDDKLRI